MATFKSRLAECQAFTAKEPDAGWRSLIMEVLNRWQEEPDAEKAWEMILKAATSEGREPLSPTPLIE